MKISIKKIEEVTQKKVKTDIISIGFDWATRAGISTIKTNKKYINIDCNFIEFKVQDRKQKYTLMVKALEDILNNQDIAIIEDVFVGFNRAGSMELAKYHAFAISECIRKNILYDTITARSIRSKFGIKKKNKRDNWKFTVAQWLKENLDIDLKGDDDCSDAIILALLGILK